MTLHRLLLVLRDKALQIIEVNLCGTVCEEAVGQDLLGGRALLRANLKHKL